MKAEKKILVIDDNENNLLLIQYILEKSHPEYIIIMASSGVDGIEIAQSELPEAILLDIFMPEMDGFETCRILKSTEITSSIPILMISAGGQSSEIRIEGLHAGADAFISKPFEKEEFVALVNVMLRIKNAEDKLKKQNQELEDSLMKISDYQVRLKKMNAELTITEEKERRKIAVYLHDGVSQILSLVSIKLTALNNSEQLPKTEKTIRESVELINNAISETRSLTYDLSPPILYELGLVPAMQWKLDQIEKKHGIVSTINNTADSLVIDNNIKILIYRIISELLSNIIKHANANLIKVEMYKDQIYLYISVSDNGKGFNYNEQTKMTDHGGFGLFSIREQLDSIQGTLNFESENNSGTKAIMQIPL